MKLNLEADLYKDDLEKIKDIKPGDILYTGVYDNNTKTVYANSFIYNEEITSPSSERQSRITRATYDEETNKYIPIKKTNKEGNEIDDSLVTNITKGFFISEKHAILAIRDMFKEMYDAAEKALKECK